MLGFTHLLQKKLQSKGLIYIVSALNDMNTDYASLFTVTKYRKLYYRWLGADAQLLNINPLQILFRYKRR